MYLSNKYTIVYNNIVNRAKSRVLDGYGENHHIIPKNIEKNYEYLILEKIITFLENITPKKQKKKDV
jgi:hypothetical protein